MKFRVLLLVAILLLAWAVGAVVSRPLGTYAPVAGENRLPGVALAQGISQLTGVAVSPLLGVSAVGAWRFHETPAAQRHLLPWFCRPYVWGVTFALLAVCLLKDLLGTAAPPFIKKPLDLLELFENKLSALVACSAFLPFIVSELTEEQRLPGGASLSAAAHLQFASVFALPAGMDARLLTIPMAVVGFLMVWLACHAINVLIVLCPFGFIDAALKLFKASVLMALVSASFIHPYLGAAVSLLIVFAAGLIAPWAFRLGVFGTFFGFDFIFPRRARRRVEVEAPHVFLGRKLAGVPVRTYGRLVLAESGHLTFVYRPSLVFRQRVLVIPTESFAISKGLLFPSLRQAGSSDQRPATLAIFLPRYRSHEETLASHFAVLEVEDHAFTRGFRAVRAWVRDMLGLGKAPA